MTNICLTTLFYHIDEHNKNFIKNDATPLLSMRSIGARCPERHMPLTEMMTIMIYFGFSGYKTFKDYYTRYVFVHLAAEFPILYGIKDKIYEDKGSIVNPEMRKKFFDIGIKFITKIRSNMKNVLIHTLDKIILSYRGIIESVGNVLKNTFSFDRSRHLKPKTGVN